MATHELGEGEGIWMPANILPILCKLFPQNVK